MAEISSIFIPEKFEFKYKPKKEQGSRQPPRRLEGEGGGLDWWFDWGWIKIEKITNNSSHDITFKNPYEGNEGSIGKGQSESSGCVGYIPYYSYPNKYVIKYYDTCLKDWTEIIFKDLDGDWLLSIVSADSKGNIIDEDIRDVFPQYLYDLSKLEITVTDNGYQIYDETWGAEIAAFYRA